MKKKFYSHDEQQTFQLCSALGQGAFGQVYKAVEVESRSPCAIKIVEKPELFLQELEILEKIRQNNLQGLSQLISHGSTGDGWQFLALELQGKNLKFLQTKSGLDLDLQNVCLLGIQLVDSLESLHSIGYVHLDIKLENVVASKLDIDYSGALPDFCLIDYGLSAKYRSEGGKHLPKAPTQGFSGNLLFNSFHSFQHIQMSRRDDLISLIYMLLYLVQGSLPWMHCLTEANCFQKVRNLKTCLAPEQIIDRSSPRSIYFLEMLKYVYGLEFSEEPNYNFLRGQLQEIAQIEADRSRFSQMTISYSSLKDSRLKQEKADMKMTLLSLIQSRKRQEEGKNSPLATLKAQQTQGQDMERQDSHMAKTGVISTFSQIKQISNGLTIDRLVAEEDEKELVQYGIRKQILEEWRGVSADPSDSRQLVQIEKKEARGKSQPPFLDQIRENFKEADENLSFGQYHLLKKSEEKGPQLSLSSQESLFYETNEQEAREVWDHGLAGSYLLPPKGCNLKAL